MTADPGFVKDGIQPEASGAGGVMPATAMKLARHKSIVMTMEYYTHVLITDERTALSKLPPLAKAHSRDNKGGTATSAA